MAIATPQWEWRTWGTTFGAVDKALCQLTSASRTIRETYILSNASPAAVRIRHSTLDVRLPLDVDAQGVRLWSAPYQAMFPLNAGAVARVFALWQLRRPRLTRARYDVDTFLNDIVAPHADLDAVDIVEERHLVFIDSCAVEVSDVWFDGYPLRTLAISMSDRERVVKTVRGLGLSGCQSVDYVQALKRYLAIRGTEWRVAQREAYTRQNVSRGASEVM